MFEIGGKKIPGTLAEIVDPACSALLIWDMEYAIGPNAFNYKEMLPKLQELSALARRSFIPCRPDSIWSRRRPACGCASG
ncbi:MAG TPA: hypothetical protein VJ733_10220 [Candidatus Binatia bacterium]|nr:hypothetical protein [Candidatus Binatia bacterium]